jgi:hypothetical protein
VGGEELGEVVEQGALLEAAGGVCAEESLDARLAV